MRLLCGRPATGLRGDVTPRLAWGSPERQCPVKGRPVAGSRRMSVVSARACVGVLLTAITAAPVVAQTNLTGIYAPRFHEDQPDRIPGPDYVDWAGLPINDAARARGLAWDARLLTLPEHQCKMHDATYGAAGPGNLRISQDVDPASQRVIAIRIDITNLEQRRVIYMDGRPHAPEFAAHTWQGFSTGHWDGETLVVRTTHIKAGLIRRNGIMHSDLATLTERWRRHGDYLSRFSILEDPVYLTEPHVRTLHWAYDRQQGFDPYPCTPVVEIAGREKGFVPHFLFGAHPHLEEFSGRYALPLEAAMGGAETMYPEFARRLEELMRKQTR